MFDVAAQDGVARKGQVGLGVEAAGRPVVAADAKPGPKTLGLIAPVGEDAGWRNDEAASLKRAEDLEGFSETHVIGQ